MRLKYNKLLLIFLVKKQLKQMANPECAVPFLMFLKTTQFRITGWSKT